MQKVSANIRSDFYLHGCVPSFVVTADGAVLVDTPNLPSDAMRWREQIAAAGSSPRFIINTEAHTDHVYGNSYFPSATVVAQEGMASRYASGIERMHSPARIEELAKGDPDSVWLVDHPDYPPNHPATTFGERLVFEVGDHTFECLHLPGHTAEQTAVFVKEEGVVFTGDNVFSGCKTWMQEGDPWAWLASLERIGKLDFVTLVPGHGEARDRRYLARQAEVVSNWLAVVESFVARGLSEHEAIEQQIDVKRSIDPYPIGQGYYAADERVTKANVRNLYRRIIDRERIQQP